MALTALKRQPAEQMAAEALKEEILTGAMKPGERPDRGGGRRTVRRLARDSAYSPPSAEF